MSRKPRKNAVLIPSSHGLAFDAHDFHVKLTAAVIEGDTFRARAGELEREVSETLDRLQEAHGERDFRKQQIVELFDKLTAAEARVTSLEGALREAREYIDKDSPNKRFRYLSAAEREEQGRVLSQAAAALAPPATASETGKQHCKECGGIDPTKDEAEKHNRHPGVCIGCVNFCWREYGGDCATPAPPRVEPATVNRLTELTRKMGPWPTSMLAVSPDTPQPATVERCPVTFTEWRCEREPGHDGLHEFDNGERSTVTALPVSPNGGVAAAMREAAAHVAQVLADDYLKGAAHHATPIASKEQSFRCANACAFIAREIRALPLPPPAPMAVAVEERTAKLEAVAEAARLFLISWSDEDSDEIDRADALRVAIEALAATKEPAHDIAAAIRRRGEP
jgi:hypothetical protein